MNMDKDIIFWLDGPPVCCKGLFDKVAEQWQGKAYYVCTKGIDENRALIVNDCGEATPSAFFEYIYPEKIADKEQYITEFLQQHRNDIHIFNGYKSGSSKYMRQLLRLHQKAHIIVWAERPHPYVIAGSHLKSLLKSKLNSISHMLYAYWYSKRIAALFPLGEKGVEAYRTLGWPKDKLFPILYLPEMTLFCGEPQSSDRPPNVRFVYLGRFSAGGKGVDLLLDACKQLKNDNYTLELVGGYGDYKEQTLEYISSNPHLSFGGTWPIREACQRLHDYDICIVPSRLEGWNVTVNEAIMAGIGCIVTDEAVSDEMISTSGAGIVTKATAVSIAEAMDRVMEDPTLVGRFKDAAYAYRNQTTAEVCAEYFIDLLEYVFYEGEKGDVPNPPWLSGE